MGILRSAAIRGVVIFLAVFGVMQLVRPDRSNPPSVPSQHLSAHVDVPREVGAILDRSCRNCHSNDTTWPWYSEVAPVSWLVAHDVQEAREHLNISTWATRSRGDQQEALEDICKEVRRGDMPITAYRLMHREAALTPADVEAMCAWTAGAVQALARPGGS
jgi:hypothetical protein